MSSTSDPHPPSKKRKDAEEVILIESGEEESLPPTPTRPSLEVVDLQQQLRKKDNMYKRACRAAREAELRADQAEKLLDSKRDVINGARMAMDEDSKKKLDELSEQVEKEKDRADVSSRYNLELLYENAQLRRVITEEKRRFEELLKSNEELLKNNEELLKSNEELLKKNAELSRENKVLKRQCKSLEESQMRDRSKNAELLIKLAKYEKAEVSSQKQPRPLFDPTNDMPVGQVLKMIRRSTKGQDAAPPQVEVADPINIFKLCSTNGAGALSLTVAAAKLNLKYTKTAMEKWKHYCRDSNEGLECEVCKTVVSKADVFAHFFTQRHTKLVHARNAAVSPVALQHWLHELQKATDGAAAAAAPSTSAAARAAATAAELQKVSAALATVDSPASPEPEDHEEEDNISIEH